MKKSTKEKLTQIIVSLVIIGMIFGGLGGTIFLAYSNNQLQKEQAAKQQQQAEARLAQIQAQLEAATTSAETTSEQASPSAETQFDPIPETTSSTAAAALDLSSFSLSP